MKKTLLSVFVLFFSTVGYTQEKGLLAAIDHDDVSTIKQLDVNSDSIQSLLFLSIQKKAKAITEFLISKGASYAVFNSAGSTPLILAVSGKDEEMVKLLLQKGANPNQAEREGLQGTPLMYASPDRGLEIPQLLVSNGADVNVVDINNDPAINWATYYGNIPVMKFLIKNGADLSIQSKHGVSVDVGLRLWHSDSVVDVFRATVFNKKLDDHSQKLLDAVREENPNKVAEILKKRPAKQWLDGLGTPFLQIAAEAGNSKMVALLLSKGANPNQLNRVGQTPLAFAARFNHVEIVKQLLDAGADPNKTGSNYQLTPLMGAAVGGDEMIGRILIDAGANLADTDVVNQCSALHWAMFYKNTSFGEMLLARGADYNKKVLDESYTGYTLAEAYGYDGLVNRMKFLESEKNKLIGSWKINEIQYIYTDTTLSVNPVHQGRLIITPKRYHIIYNPWILARAPFKSLSKPSEAEIKSAFQTLVFNTGTYEMSDTLFVTTADIAKVPGFEGGKQYYTISSFSGDALELIMKDETYPSGEKPEWYQKLQILFKLSREK